MPLFARRYGALIIAPKNRHSFTILGDGAKSLSWLNIVTRYGSVLAEVMSQNVQIESIERGQKHAGTLKGKTNEMKCQMISSPLPWTFHQYLPHRAGLMYQNLLPDIRPAVSEKFGNAGPFEFLHLVSQMLSFGRWIRTPIDGQLNRQDFTISWGGALRLSGLALGTLYGSMLAGMTWGYVVCYHCVRACRHYHSIGWGSLAWLLIIGWLQGCNPIGVQRWRTFTTYNWRNCQK